MTKTREIHLVRRPNGIPVLADFSVAEANVPATGEGEVKMNLASNGNVELMLPSPRWPDSVDMKGTASFVGATLLFKADTAGSKCQTADARYVVSRTEDELHIAGLGMDTCGNRRAALVGTWKKS